MAPTCQTEVRVVPQVIPSTLPTKEELHCSLRSVQVVESAVVQHVAWVVSVVPVGWLLVELVVGCCEPSVLGGGCSGACRRCGQEESQHGDYHAAAVTAVFRHARPRRPCRALRLSKLHLHSLPQHLGTDALGAGA